MGIQAAGGATKKALVQVHLWLGLGLSVLFFVWFVSGIVMMYSGYTTFVGDDDRLERLSQLQPDQVGVTPNQALGAAEVGSPSTLRMETLLGVPVYRIPRSGGGWITVRADDATVLPPLSPDEARAAAVEFFGGGDPVLDRTLERADVWTLTAVHEPAFPMYRFRMGDDAGTMIHVSPGSAEIANRSTRTERALAFSGAVIHFLYLPQLRRDPGNRVLWRWVVVALSGLGAVLCVSGLVLGLIYLRGPGAKRRNPGIAWSPFVGIMKWHHYLGLIFGLVTFTWVLSGMLSLNPGYAPTSGPSSFERQAVAGGPLAPELFRLPVEDAIESVQGRMVVKEVEWIRFLGVPYYLLRESSYRTLLVRADRLQAPDPVDRVRMEELALAARAAFPRASVAEERVLEEYDLYYYSRDRAYDRGATRRLPVLRLKMMDAGRTWAYMDPYSASMVMRRDRLSRAQRWAFNFLHSFDLPLLLRNRPAWDLLMLVLMAGGTVLAGTGVWLTGRWVFRTTGKSRGRAPDG